MTAEGTTDFEGMSGAVSEKNAEDEGLTADSESPSESDFEPVAEDEEEKEDMFSVPRGFTDGFNQWIKQVAALCLTAFLQTTLLYLGLLTFSDHMVLGLGIMMAAGEVPRIAQQFGLESNTKTNMMQAIHLTSTAVNLTRSVSRAVGK